MVTEKYLAHISEDNREQTIKEHLYGTSKLCEGFAAEFRAGENGRLTGMLHDIGKYSEDFQKRLIGGPRTDHSTAGAFECWKNGSLLEAIAVSGHHSGLPDIGTKDDNSDEGTFMGRMSKAAKKKISDYSNWKKEVNAFRNVPIPVDRKSSEDMMFYTRMIFSCLVDADYSDTDSFMSNVPLDLKKGDTIDVLLEKLQNYIKNWFPPKSELNEKRCKILSNCMEKGEILKKGLYTLTVPTGGGKTVASLTFALKHAKANGLKRIFYIIPYTSIIEQNAQVFREILGRENVLEHHSGIDFDNYGEVDSKSIYFARAAEDWNIPVVVTTAVQFFESLFSNKPSKCRKLHNLANSVIIFDEAQMIPTENLRPCVYAISQLIKNYGATAVLCTATQPALSKIFAKFLPNLDIKEICDEKTLKWDDFKRVTFKNAGKVSWGDIAEKISNRKQALCIVNTRKNAGLLYEMLEKEGSFHLSTLMYPQHRKKVIAEIRRRLSENLPCKVISTSLIEAGVDIDFPCVFKEINGLDSILQAAGRCNREGKRSREESIVEIFTTDSKIPDIFKTQTDISKMALGTFKDPGDREAIAYYFNSLMYLKGNEVLDRNNILDLINREPFKFATLSQKFKMIDDKSKTVYIPLEQGKELLEQLYRGEINKQLFRRLGQFGISVYENHLKELLSAGDVEAVNGSFVLKNLNLYSENTGLSLSAEYGKEIFV